MPKMKTHKGIKKRVRVTATGKLKRRHAHTGHLMSGKSGKRCRGLRRPCILNKAIAGRMLIALAGAKA